MRAALPLILLLGCVQPGTQLLLSIDADDAIRARATELEIQFFSSRGGSERVSELGPRRLCLRDCDGSEQEYVWGSPIPFSPANADTSVVLDADVSAFAGTELLVRQSGSYSFRRNVLLEAVLTLSERCSGVVCEGESRCSPVTGRCTDRGICAPGENRPCGISVGACTRGTETCPEIGRWTDEVECEGAIDPVAEQPRNGVDDDCDGETDETLPPPALQLPRNGEVVGNVHSGVLASLRWAPASGARATEVVLGIACDGTGSACAPLGEPECIEGDAMERELDVESVARPVGARAYWRARSCLSRDCGECGEWSSTRYFEAGRLRTDFDGDGRADLLIATRDGFDGGGRAGSLDFVSGVDVNRGTTRVSSRSLAPAALEGVDPDEAGIAVGLAGVDIDGDGFADAVGGLPGWDRFFVAYGSEDGLGPIALREDPIEPLGRPADLGMAIAAADPSGNGQPGVLVLRSGSERGIISFSASFSNPRDLLLDVPSIRDGNRGRPDLRTMLAVGDTRSTGRMDVLFALERDSDDPAMLYALASEDAVLPLSHVDTRTRVLEGEFRAGTVVFMRDGVNGRWALGRNSQIELLDASLQTLGGECSETSCADVSLDAPSVCSGGEILSMVAVADPSGVDTIAGTFGQGDALCVFAWRPAEAVRWLVQEVGRDVEGAHAIVALDLDGDGHDELAFPGDSGSLVVRFGPDWDEEARWSTGDRRFGANVAGAGVSSGSR